MGYVTKKAAQRFEEKKARQKVSEYNIAAFRSFPVLSVQLCRNDLLHGGKALFKIQLRGIQQHGVLGLFQGSRGAVGVLN